MEFVYLKRRHGGKFDTRDLRRQVEALPGSFPRRVGDTGFLIARDAFDRQECMAVLRNFPDEPMASLGWIDITGDEISIYVGSDEKINNQIRTIVEYILSHYDCLVSDGSIDVTKRVLADVNAIF